MIDSALFDEIEQQILLGIKHYNDLDKFNKLSHYNPYPKQKEFHNASKDYREILLSASNQSGKTYSAAYQAAIFATGLYPSWWEGLVIDRPTTGIVCGERWQLVRDNMQRLLLGTTDYKAEDELGTGSIPRDLLVIDSIIAGPVSGAVAQFRVKYANGGLSTIHVVPYMAGRKAIQSYTADWIWYDEEPPISFYLEGMTRTNVNMGPNFTTFTPLLGMSDVVLRFFEPDPKDEGSKKRKLVQMTLDDAEHYTPEERKEIEASYPPHERDARCRGIPKLGSGAIYPISSESYTVDPFAIPDHWPRAYGLDVGWNRTAAVWGAINRETDTLFLYHEYYVGQEKPAVHAAAIKAPGDIPGVIDPASRGRTQTDGKRLIDEYRAAGLRLLEADNGVESGIYKVWDRLSTGRIKIFSNLRNLLSEMGTYRRDDNGKRVKERDHAVDAMRYLVMSGIKIAEYPASNNRQRGGRPSSWRV